MMSIDTYIAPDAPVLDCGHPPSPHSGISTGWGEDSRDGKRYCYDCCKARDIEAANATGKLVAYLSEDGKAITGWPGYRLMVVTAEWQTSAGGFARRTQITHVKAIDEAGQHWHGRGPGRGMYIRMTRSSDKRRRR